MPDDWWQNGDPWGREGLDFAILDIVGRLEATATPIQAREEMTFEEMALVLQAPVSTVKSRVQRALSTLRKSLSP